MKVKEGIKIYYGVEDIREFEPQNNEFYVFISKNKEDKEEIFVEQALVRNLGRFWSLEDAWRYAKFKKQEGDINSLFEKYERVIDQLNKIINQFKLRQCKECGIYNSINEVCYNCGFDESTGKFHNIK